MLLPLARYRLPRPGSSIVAGGLSRGRGSVLWRALVKRLPHEGPWCCNGGGPRDTEKPAASSLPSVPPLRVASGEEFFWFPKKLSLLFLHSFQLSGLFPSLERRPSQPMSKSLPRKCKQIPWEQARIYIRLSCSWREWVILKGAHLGLWLLPAIVDYLLCKTKAVDFILLNVILFIFEAWSLNHILRQCSEVLLYPCVCLFD